MLTTATDKLLLAYNLKVKNTPKYQLFNSETVFQQLDEKRHKACFYYYHHLM